MERDCTVAVRNLGSISAIWTALFVITLLYMVVAKVSNSEDLLNKSKNICEKLLYYGLVVVGFGVIYIKHLHYLLFFVLGVLGVIDPLGSNVYIISRIEPLIVGFASLFFRLKRKNKNASYLVLEIYLWLAILFSSVLSLMSGTA